MNKGITRQDIVNIFAHICPDVNFSEEQIREIANVTYGGGTSYEVLRNNVLEQIFRKVITELNNTI